MGLTSLLPLVILFAVVGGAAYFGYQIYLWSNELADRGQKHMEKKNMTFTKDGGLKVGIKQMGAEEYADRTQRLVFGRFRISYGRCRRARDLPRCCICNFAVLQGNRKERTTC